MPFHESGILPSLKILFDREVRAYGEVLTVTDRNTIPAKIGDFPADSSNNWLRIKDVICVYVDLKGSTALSASKHQHSTAKVYRAFVNTAARTFSELEAPYVDVKGDGIFGLFNYNQPYRALVAAVSIKTFLDEWFVREVRKSTGLDILGYHLGAHMNTVLVKRLGKKMVVQETTEQNEVWAGKTVNMAAKLAMLGKTGEFLVSDPFYKLLVAEKARKSCGCVQDKSIPEAQRKRDLWEAIRVDDQLDEGHPYFNFTHAYKLKSCWCKNHGREFAEALIKLDVNG